MRKHYADALALGVRVARDGLPWRHDPAERVAAVPPGMQVIWDLCHFDPPERPELHAIRCARALGAGASILAETSRPCGPCFAGALKARRSPQPSG